MKLTYGAELELTDFDRNIVIPSSLGYLDKNEISIVNSNGVASNPYIKNSKGGEVNTRVCKTPRELSRIVSKLVILLQPNYNYSCWLNIHIGLSEKLDLKKLKELLKQLHKASYEWIHYTNITPVRTTYDMRCPKEIVVRRNLTRTSIMSEEEYAKALGVKDIKSFWECFKRKRTIINLTTIPIYNTIEFRAFYMTLNPLIILKTTYFCRDIVKAALRGKLDILNLLYKKIYIFPRSHYIDLDLEAGWLKTKAKEKKEKVRYEYRNKYTITK